MYDRRDSDLGPRPMFTPKEGVMWTCAQCGAEIKELPFQPRSDESGAPTSPIYCRECHRSRMQTDRPRRRF